MRPAGILPLELGVSGIPAAEFPTPSLIYADVSHPVRANAMPPHADRTPLPASNLARWFADEVQPHEPALRAYLRQQFPSIEADDVVQESYAKLLKGDTARKIASAKAYFFSVARNTALTFFHRRRIYSPIPVNELPDWRVLDGGADAAETANIHFRLELVATAIARLPERCGEIVTLAAIDGLTSSEIAKRLGLSPATVRVQIARGVRKISDDLRRRGELP